MTKEARQVAVNKKATIVSYYPFLKEFVLGSFLRMITTAQSKNIPNVLLGFHYKMKY